MFSHLKQEKNTKANNQFFSRGNEHRRHRANCHHDSDETDQMAQQAKSQR